MITFKEAYDRVVTAYLQDKVKPFSSCACFVGNLLNGSPVWCLGRHIFFTELEVRFKFDHYFLKSSEEAIQFQSEFTYDAETIYNIEQIFMSVYVLNAKSSVSGQEINEDALWLAFVAALDKLREFHISLGEDVDEVIMPRREKLLQQSL